MGRVWALMLRVQSIVANGGVVAGASSSESHCLCNHQAQRGGYWSSACYLSSFYSVQASSPWNNTAHSLDLSTPFDLIKKLPHETCSEVCFRGDAKPHQIGAEASYHTPTPTPTLKGKVESLPCVTHMTIVKKET